jgi:hypothetical protein
VTNPYAGVPFHHRSFENDAWPGKIPDTWYPQEKIKNIFTGMNRSFKIFFEKCLTGLRVP